MTSPCCGRSLKGATLEASWRNWETQSALLRFDGCRSWRRRTIGSLSRPMVLQDELSPEVPEEQITLARADARRDMAAFLSYAVGCMMGRYSLDHPGLILANAGDSMREFLEEGEAAAREAHFCPDEDGIIPVLDGEWFEDDIVARTREFLRATFGEAAVCGRMSASSSESLGEGLAEVFPHRLLQRPSADLQETTYLLDGAEPPEGLQRSGLSPPLHPRHDESGAESLSAGIPGEAAQPPRPSDAGRQTERDVPVLATKLPPARKRTNSPRRFTSARSGSGETLLPLAQARIELDLDDGVKANYLKLGEALAPIPGLAGRRRTEGMKRIHDSLQRVFQRNRLVFWYDSTGEWGETFEPSRIEGCEAQGCAKRVRHKGARRSRPGSRRKVSALRSTARPADADNWLLDLLLQGYEYKADKASLALQEVGLPHEFLLSRGGARCVFPEREANSGAEGSTRQRRSGPRDPSEDDGGADRARPSRSMPCCLAFWIQRRELAV